MKRFDTKIYECVLNKTAIDLIIAGGSIIFAIIALIAIYAIIKCRRRCKEREKEKNEQ